MNPFENYELLHLYMLYNTTKDKLDDTSKQLASDDIAEERKREIEVENLGAINAMHLLSEIIIIKQKGLSTFCREFFLSKGNTIAFSLRPFTESYNHYGPIVIGKVIWKPDYPEFETLFKNNQRNIGTNGYIRIDGDNMNNSFSEEKTKRLRSIGILTNDIYEIKD